MEIIKSKNGWRIKPRQDEEVSLVTCPGASIETVGKRGGYTVKGAFSAVSLESHLSDFYGSVSLFVDIFATIITTNIVLKYYWMKHTMRNFASMLSDQLMRQTNGS